MEKKFNLEANDATWRALFKGSLKIVTDNYLRWFQYKILYNILDTNDYLFKIKVSDTNLCRMCKEYPETTVHLFVQCPQVISLWNNIVQWIKSRLLIQIDLTNARKILGYEQYDQHFWPLNFQYHSRSIVIFHSSNKLQLLLFKVMIWLGFDLGL